MNKKEDILGLCGEDIFDLGKGLRILGEHMIAFGECLIDMFSFSYAGGYNDPSIRKKYHARAGKGDVENLHDDLTAVFGDLAKALQKMEADEAFKNNEPASTSSGNNNDLKIT